jgi:hypothetical protein
MSRCVNCGIDLGRSRSDRRTCSARCRVALSRRLQPGGDVARGARHADDDADGRREVAQPGALDAGHEQDDGDEGGELEGGDGDDAALGVAARHDGVELGLDTHQRDGEGEGQEVGEHGDGDEGCHAIVRRMWITSVVSLLTTCTIPCRL